MKYAPIRTVVDAITFEELIEYGRGYSEGKWGGLPESMPFQFEYKGKVIVRESHNCYLIPDGIGGKMWRGDMLVTNADGSFRIMHGPSFRQTYEPI